MSPSFENLPEDEHYEEEEDDDEEDEDDIDFSGLCPWFSASALRPRAGVDSRAPHRSQRTI